MNTVASILFQVFEGIFLFFTKNLSWSHVISMNKRFTMFCQRKWENWFRFFRPWVFFWFTSSFFFAQQVGPRYRVYVYVLMKTQATHRKFLSVGFLPHIFMQWICCHGISFLCEWSVCNLLFWCRDACTHSYRYKKQIILLTKLCFFLPREI